MVSDSQGRLHLVYGESSGGPFQQYHIRYALRDAGSDRFSKPRQITESDAGGDSVNFPDLAVDAADRLYVVWELSPDRRHYSRDLGFTMSGDGGATFTRPVVVPGSDDPGLGVNGSRQGFLMSKLAVNAEGAVALVNSTFNPGDSSHLAVAKNSRSALTAWGPSAARFTFDARGDAYIARESNGHARRKLTLPLTGLSVHGRAAWSASGRRGAGSQYV